MADQDKTAAAAYVSWKTFLNAIESLSTSIIPNVIDKKVFTGMAFSVQNQLFSGMRFLGLIDDKNKPTSELEELAKPSEDERKKKLKEILHGRYPQLFALNLKTTPDELEKCMAEFYGVGGDTKEKSVRFFVSAAKYVGIELSPYVLKSTNGQTRATVKKQRGTKKSPTPPPTAAPSSGTSKQVTLKSGGVLTLSASLDLFSLNSEDRKFVFDLIDQLDRYKQPDPAPKVTEAEPEEKSGE